MPGKRNDPSGPRVGGTEKCTGFKYIFRCCSQWIAHWVGSPWAFMLATLSIVAWGVTGPIFHYSDTWQLVINTATTIVTFLMVFLIQNTQNRDTKAVHLKLDELLRSMHGARNSLVSLENWTDDELEELQKEFERVRHTPEEIRTGGKSSKKSSPQERQRA